MLPGLVGLIQATETVKLVLGKGKTLMGRLLLYDAMKMQFRDVKIKEDPECELCGENATVKELIDYKAFCNIPMPTGLKPEKEPEFDESAFTITAPELEEVLGSGAKFTLIDVREPHEWDICRIEGALLIPLGTIEQQIGTLNPDEDIYLHCYKGKRSMTALKKLHKAGFTKLKSLEGGIDRWAELIDPAMPRY